MEPRHGSHPVGHEGWAGGAALVLLTLFAGGGQTGIPVDALKPDPASLEHRQLQTRRFDGIAERDISATELSGYQLRMTVTVRRPGEKQRNFTGEGGMA